MGPYDVTDAVGLAADPVSDTDERAALRRTVRTLVDTESPPERVQDLDEREAFDDHLHAVLARTGMLAIGAPPDVGGSGDVRDQLVVIEELAAGPTSMAAFMIGHYAVASILGTYATTDAHRAVLEALVTGHGRAAFALSEPAGGTDVARVMSTWARRSDDGGFVLSGRKMWTSGAAAADWIVVLARTSPITRSPADGITMFLVGARTAGVHIATVPTFGIRSMSTCEVVFDDVRAGDDAVLGDVDAGMRHVLHAVRGEGLHAAAASIGVGRAALGLALSYSREREVFGRPIGGFQVPQHWLVDGAVALESARGLMCRAAAVAVAGGDASHLAAMAKLVASDAAGEIALRGMQVMGGVGYTRAVAMQRYFRDGRLWAFSPLTNEMVRNSLGQRMLRLPRSFPSA